MKANSKNRLNKQSIIEQEIDSIFRILSSRYGDNYVLSKERASKGGSCQGLVKLTSRRDLKREAKEAADYRTDIRNGAAPETLQAPFSATPERLYAFYPSTTEPARLGSIAIYGKDLTILYFFIKRSRTLFGYSVKNITIEKGFHPFIDVTLSV